MKLLTVSAVVEAPARPGEVEIDKPDTALVNTPEFQITGGQNKRFEIKKWLEIEWPYSTKGAMVDELTFTVNIQIGGKILPGTVSYTKIPEGKHFGVLYVAPRTLESIVGRTVTANAIENVWITAANSQGVAVALFPKRQTQVPNLPRQEGLLLKKPETPFAPLYWDRYEALKPQR
ncbi:MAG: hypothetical protein EOP84_28335 [Verrucomicrobiaceae bacterium]|nr:MAG: hypothetical protein EOP84_28335 [Verrucomicrobiaceae bacterium]